MAVDVRMDNKSPEFRPFGVEAARADHCAIPMWWAHQDSNLEPKDYESSALTVEL